MLVPHVYVLILNIDVFCIRICNSYRYRAVVVQALDLQLDIAGSVPAAALLLNREKTFRSKINPERQRERLKDVK